MTFRVILRKDVIYKNNTSPLCLLFFHDNRKKSVGLGVSVVRSCWDAQAQKVTDDCPDRDDIQFQITAKIKEYEKKIKKLEALEIPVTFEALFETIGKRMDCTVGDYFRQIIDRLEKVEKYGSASKHKVTLALMSQFRSVNMRFDELDLTCLREFEIFLSQKGNVNNSCNYAAFQYWQLYLIEILHQTTTRDNNKNNRRKLYLIKILHQTTTRFALNIFSFPLYLIEILHQTTTLWIWHAAWPRCILLKFYIKPQLRRWRQCHYVVVSYWNSTSNHNFALNVSSPTVLYLIEILHQTTTLEVKLRKATELYLIEILHQTTTSQGNKWWTRCCILSKFYIKPQQSQQPQHRTVSCILSKFYIKPQLFRIRPYSAIRCILSKFYIKPQLSSSSDICFAVVSYRNSTSNHNFARSVITGSLVVSYRNSTSNHNSAALLFRVFSVVSYRNSTSNHNLSPLCTFALDVVSYRNSTSNHNQWFDQLFLGGSCILSKFYIKPQLTCAHPRFLLRCILSKFYIKPQLSHTQQ